MHQYLPIIIKCIIPTYIIIKKKKQYNILTTLGTFHPLAFQPATLVDLNQPGVRRKANLTWSPRCSVDHPSQVLSVLDVVLKAFKFCTIQNLWASTFLLTNIKLFFISFQTTYNIKNVEISTPNFKLDMSEWTIIFVSELLLMWGLHR